MKTDTPRTDAAKKEKGGMTFVWIEFAQQLEQELTESQAQSHGLARRVVEAETMLEVAERDLAASNSALDQMTEDAVTLKVEVERLKKPRYPLESFEQFCDFLTTNNIVDELAVEDPEGWDGGAELSRIEKAFDRALGAHNKIFNK